MNKEIEFKYDAGHLQIHHFVSLAKKLTKKAYYYTHGIDHFYGNKNKKKMFCRHRNGWDTNQFTVKEKLKKSDNYIRIEHNIDLADNMTEQQVKEFCSTLGFEYNTSIIKNTWIFKSDLYTLVYYVCARKNGYETVELGRFIEIEMNEDVEWKSTSQAYKELCKLEKKFKSLGISPKKRLKKSLWELYRK